MATRTTDHNDIRSWVEGRHGYPARVKGTEVRVDFEEAEPDEGLERFVRRDGEDGRS